MSHTSYAMLSPHSAAILVGPPLCVLAALSIPRGAVPGEPPGAPVHLRAHSLALNVQSSSLLDLDCEPLEGRHLAPPISSALEWGSSPLHFCVLCASRRLALPVITPSSGDQDGIPEPASLASL